MATRSATVGIPSGPGSTIVLWYVHPSHRRRKVAARRQPIPELIEVVGRSPGGAAPTYLGHWCQAEIFSIADCIFAEVVDGVGVINGSFAIAANSGKCAGRPRFVMRQRPHQLISGSVIGTVTIIPHSAGEEAGRWDQ